MFLCDCVCVCVCVGRVVKLNGEESAAAALALSLLDRADIFWTGNRGYKNL